ncbi:MAG: rhombosortase [Pseudomonadota bacterium]
MFIWSDIHQQLEFNRLLHQQHEYHRLLTSSLVHNNFHHLWLNVVGGLLIYLLFFEHFTVSNQIVLFVVCSISIGICIYYFSTYNIYMGLSGYLHGVFAWAVLKELLENRKSAWLLAVGGIAKLAYEQFSSPTPVNESLIGIEVATDAHLFGVLSGVLLCLCSFALTKLRTRPSTE